MDNQTSQVKGFMIVNYILIGVYGLIVGVIVIAFMISGAMAFCSSGCGLCEDDGGSSDDDKCIMDFLEGFVYVCYKVRKIWDWLFKLIFFVSMPILFQKSKKSVDFYNKMKDDQCGDGETNDMFDFFSKEFNDIQKKLVIILVVVCIHTLYDIIRMCYHCQQSSNSKYNCCYGSKGGFNKSNKKTKCFLCPKRKEKYPNAEKYKEPYPAPANAPLAQNRPGGANTGPNADMVALRAEMKEFEQQQNQAQMNQNYNSGQTGYGSGPGTNPYSQNFQNPTTQNLIQMANNSNMVKPQQPTINGGDQEVPKMKSGGEVKINNKNDIQI